MPLLIYRHLHGEERFNLFKNLTVLGSASGGDVQLEQDGVAEEHAHILRNADGSFTIASLGRGKQVLVNGVKEKKATLQGRRLHSNWAGQSDVLRARAKSDFTASGRVR